MFHTTLQAVFSLAQKLPVASPSQLPQDTQLSAKRFEKGCKEGYA